MSDAELARVARCGRVDKPWTGLIDTYLAENATRLGDLRDVIALEVDTIANRARYGTYQGCDAETKRLIAAIGGEDALIVRGDKP